MIIVRETLDDCLGLSLRSRMEGIASHSHRRPGPVFEIYCVGSLD